MNRQIRSVKLRTTARARSRAKKADDLNYLLRMHHRKTFNSGWFPELWHSSIERWEREHKNRALTRQQKTHARDYKRRSCRCPITTYSKVESLCANAG
jgi:hypothetical protein